MKAILILMVVLSMSSCQWIFGKKPEVAERQPSEVAKEAATEIADKMDESRGPLAGLEMVKGYPVARPVPGKEGHVYNPYTQNEVDVRGLSKHLLVRDPKDLDPNHAFRTP